LQNSLDGFAEGCQNVLINFSEGCQYPLWRWSKFAGRLPIAPETCGKWISSLTYFTKGQFFAIPVRKINLNVKIKLKLS
jgi:hypothetical protein